MKDGTDISERELAYAWARHGALALAARPYLQAAFEFLVRRLTRRQAFLVLSVLALTFVISGQREGAHGRSILTESAYSAQRTETFGWGVELGRDGDRRNVAFEDWVAHQFWRVLRLGSGSAFVAAGLLAWAALGEQARRQKLADAFGADSPEYARLASPPDLELLDREDLRHDWLLSGAPSPARPNSDPDRPRPRFGRTA